jgi:hypothetical protein
MRKSRMMTDPIYSNQYCVGLFRRAVLQRDQQARETVQQCFTETVRGWLHRHPKREMACGPGSGEQHVAQVFARCWQTADDRQVDVRTVADVLRYLRVHVNVVLLDALRASTKPGEMVWPHASNGEEPGAVGRHERSEVWDMLCMLLPDPREQHLAYLLFHCGLSPREIVRTCPEEWSSEQEVSRLRYLILERLLQNEDQIPW